MWKFKRRVPHAAAVTLLESTGDVGGCRKTFRPAHVFAYCFNFYEANK